MDCSPLPLGVLGAVTALSVLLVGGGYLLVTLLR